MPGIAPLRALQGIVALALAGQTAASAVHERDHAVDVGESSEHAGAIDSVGHEAGDGGGAVHAGEDADVVARARLAVGAAIALEGRPRFRPQ